VVWDVIASLPPGSASRTHLARKQGEARLFALREVEDGCEPFWPEPSSPAVLPLIEMATVQGKRCAVFPYVPGATLREVVEMLRSLGKAPPLGMVGRVVVSAARAVASIAPARPHGGLSDASLLIGFDGATRVLDFGAPRQSRFSARGRLQFASDVFSLGATLHASLTGFNGHYAEALDEGVRFPGPTQVYGEATPQLDEALNRALSRSADGRQPDTEQLADELEQAMSGAIFRNEDVATLLKAIFRERQTVMSQLERQEAPRGIPPTTQPGQNKVTSMLGLDTTQPGVKVHVPGQGGDPVAHEPTRPRASNPLAMRAKQSEPAPDPQQLVDEPTGPRHRVAPQNAFDIAAAAGFDDEGAATRSERRRQSAQDNPFANAENTTDAERAQAAGQSQIFTPPVGTKALTPRRGPRRIIAFLLTFMAAGAATTAAKRRRSMSRPPSRPVT
jgi:hypothetical protein